MGTRYLFEKAVKISQNFSASDKTSVLNLCKNIQKSQKELIGAADAAMLHCLEQCKGRCCKSLDIDSIFSLWDFIFIVMLQPHLKKEIQKRLDAYTPQDN